MDYILGGESALGLAAQTARQIIELGTERTQPKDFDYQTKDYSIDTTITDDYKNGYNGNLVSELGTPVYSEVTFGNASWQTENTSSFYGINFQFIINKPPVITFQAILCSVVFTRNIVKTEIQGLDGTV